MEREHVDEAAGDSSVDRNVNARCWELQAWRPCRSFSKLEEDGVPVAVDRGVRHTRTGRNGGVEASRIAAQEAVTLDRKSKAHEGAPAAGTHCEAGP